MGTNGSFYQNGLPISTVETGLGNVPATTLPAPKTAESSFYIAGSAYAQANPVAAAAYAANAAASAAAAAASAAAVPALLSTYALKTYVDAQDTAVTAAFTAADTALSGTLTTAIGLKANAANAALTGVPVAPTAAPGTNTTQLANTAFVEAARVILAAADALKSPLASPAFTGVPTTAATPAALDNSLKLATTAYADLAVGVEKTRALAAEALLAPLASPTFTGAPLSTTPTAGDNSLKIATTAFVTTALSSFTVGRPLLSGPRTYYVRVDGSDTAGTGLTNAAYVSGSFPQNCAFLTLQKAINVCLTLDLNGFLVTIQVGAGTYANGFSLNGMFVGGNVQVVGDNTTPSNCLIACASGNNPFYVSGVGSQITVGGFKTTSSGGAIHLYASDGGLLNFAGKWEFGAATSGVHVSGARGGQITIGNGSSYLVSGGANYHISLSTASTCTSNLTTITTSGTPAFGIAWAGVVGNSVYQFVSSTCPAAGATGTRNTVSAGGGVDTGGGLAANTSFPGSVTGSTTGGWWL